MSNVYSDVPGSNQEAFNRVWQRFVVEKAPRAVEGINKMCVYRSEQGECAFGLQLPDEFYRPEFENATADAVLGSAAVSTHGSNEIENRIATIPGYLELQQEIRHHFRFVASQLLVDLQSAHDGAEDGLASSDSYSIEQRLRNVAASWGLQVEA